MLRLSIIVNMYNTAKYMQKCVDSLLEQDIPAEEYEIIFVDDCSPDNSLAMAKEYEVRSKSEEERTKWPAVKVCHHEVNKGLAAGRNTGLYAAEGKYLCFVDPDDYIEKNSLKALLDQMDAENLDMLRFNYQKVDEEYYPMPDLPAETEFDYTPGIMTGTEFLQHRLGIACYVWAYIYRRERIKNIRFVEGCRIDDSPWLPRVLQISERVNCVNVRHQYYLQRQGSLVRASRTPESVKKVLAGSLQLMDIMLPHMEESVPEAKDWYHRFISYTAFSAMSNIIYLPKIDAWRMIDELKTRGCFPLKNRTYKHSAAIRKMIMNISPKLYWILLKK